MIEYKDKKESLTKYKNQVEFFLNETIEAREASERDRDYYDGHQWSDEEVQKLKNRNQAPIVVNRVKPKVEGLKGLLDIRKTDIKAYPRNPGQDESAAHAFTDGLRYVEDNTDFECTQKKVFEDMIVEGYGACIVETEQNIRGEEEIKINRIPWDRFYFDPHSTQLDFSDAQYLGQMLWLDADQLKIFFPNKKKDIDSIGTIQENLDETFEDKPRWSMGESGRKRFRVAYHYFKKDGEWHVIIFTDNLILAKPQPSPYLDENGEPCCPIVGVTAYIDRDNNRYGEVRAFISQQDEINHRRSKALHLLSSRQTMSRRGAIKNVNDLKIELSKPNGHVEYNGDRGDFEILNTNDFTIGQLDLYRDAKAELDATSLNAQLSGERQEGDLSGKAIDRLQSAGAMEVNTLFMSISKFKKQVFREVTARIKQYWNREKWVRITDNQDSVKYAGLNTQVKFQEFLEERINDESYPLEVRTGAAATFQVLMAQQSPILQNIVEIKNNVAELDIDLILEQGQDVVNIQNEQFQILAQFAQSSKDIDIIELIELSQIRNKDELIDKIEQRRAAAAQANGNIANAEAQKVMVDNAKTYAEAQEKTQKAQQTAIENQLLINSPEQINSVSV